MPLLPPRKGLAPVKNSYHGYRDKVGQIFRVGKEVFVLIAHDQWGPNISAGAIPAQLNRFYAEAGDKLGAYRLDAQYIWCLNHTMLSALGQYVLEKIPDDILALMAADAANVVVTNWGVAAEFETLLEDVEMRGFYSPQPPPGAFKHVGTLTLALTPNGGLRKHFGCNYAKGFRRWSADATLSSMAPAGFVNTLPKFDDLPQPCSADYSLAPRLGGRVSNGGGPQLTNGEDFQIGADELIIYGAEYETDFGAEDPLVGFATGFFYVTGSPYSEPLVGIEMLDHERLRAMMNNLMSSSSDAATTLQLLGQPDFSKRLYLNGAKELLPGWRKVSVSHAAILRTVIVVNPSIVEGATLLRGREDTYSFECAVQASGALQPLRRCGDSVARARLPSLLHPSARAVQGMARTWLLDVIMQKTAAAGRKLDPLEITVPCPFSFVASLPCFPAMRRSPKKRHELVHIMASSDDADTIFGVLGWHAPEGKEKNGFYIICVPEPPVIVNDGATIDPRRVKGLKKNEYNFISYDTEKQELTLRLSVARFNASLRVRGASVGPPPLQPPPGGGKWKYSLLARDWVSSAVRAPTPRELKERYPSGPKWMHW